MVRSKLAGALSMLAVFGMAAFAPLAAQADGQRFPGAQLQAQKNDWRNAAIVSAAVGIYGAATHQPAATEIGVAGTVIAAGQYERDRHLQSEQDNRAVVCSPQPVRVQPVYIDRGHPFIGSAFAPARHGGTFERTPGNCF